MKVKYFNGHACIASNMQILIKSTLPIIQLFLQTNYHAFTISSVQDACLEHAEVLGALQNFENFIFPPFPIFKNIAITTYRQNIAKKLFGKFSNKY
jgi:hypothetical protein